MSVRRLAPDPVQPADFAFTPANENWIDQQIAKYPPGRQASAVIPLLWKAQEQQGWVSRAAIEAVAARLGMAPMRVLEVATFYTMFNLQPVGTYFVQLCGTTPCALRGAEALKKVCHEVIGPQSTVTADGKLSWLEVECLGACCNAPMAQINVDYYEDLTPESFRALLEDLRHGRPTKPGPQNGRVGSEPEGGPNTLKDPALYDGTMIGAGDWQARIAEQRKAAAEAAAAKAAAEAEAKKADATKADATKADATKADATKADATKADATPASAAKPASETAAAGRPKPSDPAQPSSAANDTPAAKGAIDGKDLAEAAKPAVEEAKPALLSAARDGKGDDLELIWGIGPKLGKMLNEMGVWHFDQIARWTAAELAWVDARLTGFKGRALRDDWIAQSEKLATGWRPESKPGDKPAE